MYTSEEKLACVQREVRIRKKYYPGKVERHRMSAQEAKREIELMESIGDDYAARVDKERLV